MTLEDLAVRVANLESMLRDIQGWRDPKFTVAKINTAYNQIADQQRLISNLTARVKSLEDKKEPQVFETHDVSTKIPGTPEEPKAKRTYKKRK